MRTRSRRVAGVLIAFVLTGGANAQECDWEWVNPMPPRADIYRLKHEANAFVGVGAAGTIIRSTDGHRWEVVASGVESDLFGVDWGAGSFVAVGDGVILSSNAGYDWTPVFESDTAVLLDIEFSASRYVAVGHGLEDNILTSRFGVEWEIIPVPWVGGADSIAGSSDGFFVAVGSQIWFSPDGLSWQDQGAAPVSLVRAGRLLETKSGGLDIFDLDRIDLAWSGTRLLWSGGNELWSRNLDEEWSLVTTLGGCYPFSDWLGVVAGPGWAMASGITECPSAYFDPTVSLMMSTDGGASFNNPWESDAGGFPALARYGSRWVAAGVLGDVMTNESASSWSCQGSGCSSLACADGFVDLASDGDTWVAVGGIGICDTELKQSAGGTVARSTDGSNWVVQAQPVERFHGVTFFEPMFIGVGDGWLARSSDGRTWSIESAPLGEKLNAIGSGDGWVVAVGRGGSMFASSDGLNWDARFLDITVDLDRVVWDGEQFIVLGRAGTITYSSDALRWSNGLTNATADLKGAARGSDQLIAVGDDGVILASEDGEVWAPQRSGVSSSLRDVTWAQDRFVAVGWDDRAGRFDVRGGSGQFRWCRLDPILRAGRSASADSLDGR